MAIRRSDTAPQIGNDRVPAHVQRCFGAFNSYMGRLYRWMRGPVAPQSAALQALSKDPTAVEMETLANSPFGDVPLEVVALIIGECPRKAYQVCKLFQREILTNPAICRRFDDQVNVAADRIVRAATSARYDDLNFAIAFLLDAAETEPMRMRVDFKRRFLTAAQEQLPRLEPWTLEGGIVFREDKYHNYSERRLYELAIFAIEHGHIEIAGACRTLFLEEASHNYLYHHLKLNEAEHDIPLLTERLKQAKEGICITSERSSVRSLFFLNVATKERYLGLFVEAKASLAEAKKNYHTDLPDTHLLKIFAFEEEFNLRTIPKLIQKLIGERKIVYAAMVLNELIDSPMMINKELTRAMAGTLRSPIDSDESVYPYFVLMTAAYDMEEADRLRKVKEIAPRFQAMIAMQQAKEDREKGKQKALAISDVFWREQACLKIYSLRERGK